MKIRSKLLTTVAAWCAVKLLKLLFLTVRGEIPENTAWRTPYAEPKTDERFLFCLWHDTILMCLFSRKPLHLAGLISRHQDGSYLSEAAKILDVIPVRGSASRGGAQATRQLMDTAKDRHIAITPDGPRGPEHVAKEGICYLASRTGRAIVPCAVAPSNAWRIRGSWTDMLIPKPFSTVRLVTSDPIYIPLHATREDIARYRDDLQQRMDALNRGEGVTTSPHQQRRAA